MAPAATDTVAGGHSDTHDVDLFVGRVSEVSRLIAGLKAGTISPEYVDTKIGPASDKRPRVQAEQYIEQKPGAGNQHLRQPDVREKDGTQDAAKQAELQRKVEELKANRERKNRLRRLYQEHTGNINQYYATDYTKWDLFCPSDEEDDLFNSLTPTNPQFRAMEKDINDRHNRMVEQRQLAERQRQLGNEAFKAQQYAEALRCYELGLESQKHNMTLHANAAMAALKLKCYVQAMEHCDKVLHLAEVLYNKPKDMLCVKALQRRATAYQALEQYSKAVEDLKAAVSITPGDKEISEQLQRAERLQEEHRTAKRLKGLAESTSKAEAANGHTAAGDIQLSSLRQVEQLSASLSKPAVQPQTEVDVAGLCARLKGLVQQSGSCCLYFRECGGLAAVDKLVVRAQEPKAIAACLQLLTAACDNPTTLEQLAQQPQLLATALDHMSNPDSSAVTAAAVELMYTASTAAAVRQELGKQLLARRPATAGTAGAAADRCSRLEVVWQSCASGTAPATQVLAVSLLSNCLLLPAVKEASRKLLEQKPALLDTVVSMLERSTSSNSRTAMQATLQDKVYGLLSNLSTHTACRKQLAEHKQLLSWALAAALPTQSQAETNSHTAALGLLCNLSLEAAAQQYIAGNTEVLDQLLSVSCQTLDAGNNSINSNCRGEDKPARAGPQLPARKQAAAQPQVQGASDCDVQLLQRQRAACLLSRSAKQQTGIQALREKDALQRLSTALDQDFRQPLQQQPQAVQSSKQQSSPQQDVEDYRAAWLEAMVRTIALLTAQPGACSSCSPTLVATLLQLSLRLLHSTAVDEATKGNVALCLSHLAGHPQWHQQLRKADAVKALVDVAYAGKGNATSKNAAIALAKMAKDPVMMDRLRELHGLEIIYQYVRV